MYDNLSLIGRNKNIINEDFAGNLNQVKHQLKNKSVLVIGAAGTIGQAVTIEIFKLGVKSLHVIDISENNLVALTRCLRSTEGYLVSDYQSYCIDIGSNIFDAFISGTKSYDYVFNLSALKHVRSEKDPYSLMRMIQVNILNSYKLQKWCAVSGSKYFCVSSDKAANPANLMGASKRVMELFAFSGIEKLNVSMARFANVAFSDGSLLHGFSQRLLMRQPISAPVDVQRYFITAAEAGQLCVLSGVHANSGEIYFPDCEDELKPMTFNKIAERFIKLHGYEPYLCETENEARDFFSKQSNTSKYWPCHFFRSDTTGEKKLEEFFTETEKVTKKRYKNISIVEPTFNIDPAVLELFQYNILRLLDANMWSKQDLICELCNLLPGLEYEDLGKYLDSKM